VSSLPDRLTWHDGDLQISQCALRRHKSPHAAVCNAFPEGRQGLSPTSFLPRKLYRYQCKLDSLLDLRPTTAQEFVGLSAADLSSDDPNACRAVGEAAYAAGREGVLAPSATGCGDVLAVFLERLRPSARIRDIDAELWEQVPDLPEI
jgi:hypothetical protein